ncbi:50S ribosomal protein L13 [bacterium]
MKSTFFAKNEEVKKDWLIIDAEGKVLGRLATRIADILRGKKKPIFTPHVDTGDFVIVLNADKIRLTGKKLEQKFAFRHTGYPGGVKLTRYDKLMSEKPEKAVQLAVSGMLPKNKLRAKFLKKLHIYKGTEHPHEAQKPKVIEI